MLCGFLSNLRPLWNSVVPPPTWEHYRAPLLQFRVWISVTPTWGTEGSDRQEPEPGVVAAQMCLNHAHGCGCHSVHFCPVYDDDCSLGPMAACVSTGSSLRSLILYCVMSLFTWGAFIQNLLKAAWFGRHRPILADPQVYSFHPGPPHTPPLAARPGTPDYT